MCISSTSPIGSHIDHWIFWPINDSFICDVSSHSTSEAWLRYDKKFRMAAAANPQLQWGLKNTELWLECFTGQSGKASTRTPPSSSRQFRKPCTYCSSAYHFPDNCPRNPFHFKSTPSDSSASRPLPRDRKPNASQPSYIRPICFDFNGTGCARKICHFHHQCSAC